MLANCFLGHHRYFPHHRPTRQADETLRDWEQSCAPVSSPTNSLHLSNNQQSNQRLNTNLPSCHQAATTNKQLASIKNKPKAEYKAAIMPPGSDTPPLSSGKTRQAGPTGQNYFPRCFLLIINSSAALLAIYHSGLHHRLSLVLRLYLLPQRRHKLGKLCPNNAVAANPSKWPL